MSYSYTRQVFVGEDDASGLIYFANYFRYMSEALQQIWNEAGQSLAGQIAEGFAAPAVHASCEFVSPCRAGDVLTQVVGMELGDRSSFTTVHKFINQRGDVVAEGKITRVWVDVASMRPTVLPPWIREIASAGSVGRE